MLSGAEHAEIARLAYAVAGISALLLTVLTFVRVECPQWRKHAPLNMPPTADDAAVGASSSAA